MNSHDWKTPLVQFRFSIKLASFWQTEEAKRLRDLISIKPDKLKGMIRCAERGDTWIICTPEQFAYIISEFFRFAPHASLNSYQPRLLMPPKKGFEFDIVHSSSCYMFGDD